MSDIKERISALARSLGFVKFGFKEGAFVALFPYYVKGESGNISMYARGIDYHVLAERKLLPIANELPFPAFHEPNHIVVVKMAGKWLHDPLEPTDLHPHHHIVNR